MLDSMTRSYRGRVDFLMVYIREAHPEDGWIIPENRCSGLSVYEARTEEERHAAASTCATDLRLDMPMVFDRLDNAVASSYGGWPDRLYLISSDGRIVYQGDEGPFGFKPEELDRAICAAVGSLAA